MTHFLGTHQNRIDAKGRVSVPAAFRASLRALDGDAEQLGIILMPSLLHPCIDVFPPGVFGQLTSKLERLDVFSAPHDNFATAVFAEAQPVDADKEGRIVLPDELAAHAGVTSAVVFMGLGPTFQIWEPQAAMRRREEARAAARAITFPAPVTGR